MSVFFRLFCKMLLPYVPIMLVMVFLQLVMGQISAIALDERQPEITIAFYQETKTEISNQYIAGLSQVSQIKLIRAESQSAMKDLFDSGKSHAFVVIPSSFDASVIEGLEPAVTLYIAPGITDTTIIKEYVVNQWLIMRALVLGRQYLNEGISLNEIPGNSNGLVVLNYDGTVFQEEIYTTPPAFGIPALFLLAAFLHSAGMCIGADNLNWKMKGGRALFKGNTAGLLALFILWGSSIMAYTAGMVIFFKVYVPLSVFLSMLGMCAYSLSAGGLLSFLGKRAWSIWIFIPCLLLNMTLGGGLWNASAAGIMLPMVLPVSAVLSSTGGSFAAPAILWLQTAVVLTIMYVLKNRKGEVMYEVKERTVF